MVTKLGTTKTKLRLLPKSYWLVLSFLLICFLSSCSFKQDESKPRLGYLLNITHAVPMLAIESDLFDGIKAQHFFSGGYLLNSLMAHNLDLAYLGPGPYLNALDKGVDLKLLQVSSYGASSLVLSEDYDPNQDYIIHRLAVPQLGNTQDLLARLLVSKLKAAQEKQAQMPLEFRELIDTRLITVAEDLEFVPVSPAELGSAFYTGEIDAALVAEPWGSLLEAKGLNNITNLVEVQTQLASHALETSFASSLVDALQELNKFPAALLVVSRDYYEANPELVNDFVLKQAQALDLLQESPESSVKLIQKHFKKKTGRKISENFFKTCLAKVRFEAEEKPEFGKLTEIAYKAKYFRRP